MKKNFLRAGLAALLLAVVTVLMPAPAQALTIEVNAGVTVNVPPPSPGPGGQGGLAKAFGGSPTSLLQGILCPIVKTVANITHPIPGVGPLIDQLPNVICALNVLGYVYRTIYLPTSGPPVVRYTRALAGVPTPLDVDGQGLLPDFLGSLSPNLTLNGLNLNIQRTPSFPATAKVSIEAILINPTQPNSYVGIGTDGTAVGTARYWQAKVSVFAVFGPTVDLGLDLNTTDAPSKLATIGEYFTGPNPDEPEVIYNGLLSFSPVPASFKTRLQLSDNRQGVIINTTPTVLDAKVKIVTPGRLQRVTATVDKVPSEINVVHTSTTGDRVTYDASAPIDKITGTYKDTVAGVLKTSAALDVWGFPAHLQFDQVGEKTTVGATNGGKIDRIQVRFAKDRDVDALDPSVAPFAKFRRYTSSQLAGTLQLTNLQSVEVTQGSAFTGTIKFSAAPGLFPLTADDDVTQTHVEGSLSNLPAQTTVSVDPGNGKVTFTGRKTDGVTPQGIDQIKLKATRPATSPFFASVSRLEATLDGLPADEVIDIKQENDGVTASASNPLGTITLLASDGSDAPAISGSVASFVDNGSIWRAFLRMSGLKSVGFQPDPLTADLQTSAPQVFKVNGDVGGVTFDGTITSLPSHLTFSKTDVAGGQAIDFNSHGQSIATIDVSGTGLPVPTGMPNFEALIKDLPSHITLTLPSGSGDVKLDLHGDHITRVYAQAYAPGGKITPSATRHRLDYVENSHVLANLLGVGSATFRMGSPIKLQYDINSQPLDYNVIATGLALSGTISNPQPATITIADLPGGESGAQVNYAVDQNNHTGDGSINSISLKGTLGTTFIDTTISDIPAYLDICVQASTGTSCKPDYIPGTAAGGHTVPDPDFAFHFFPAKFGVVPGIPGDVPDTTVKVSGIVCPSNGESDCNNESQAGVQRIKLNNLRFKTVEAALGQQSDDCGTTCAAHGRVWAAANTKGDGSPDEGDHLNGQVLYWDGSDTSDWFVNLNLDPEEDWIAFAKLFFFVHYDIALSLDAGIDVQIDGGFDCGDDPNLDIDVGVTLDILNGSIVSLC